MNAHRNIIDSTGARIPVELLRVVPLRPERHRLTPDQDQEFHHGKGK